MRSQASFSSGGSSFSHVFSSYKTRRSSEEGRSSTGNASGQPVGGGITSINISRKHSLLNTFKLGYYVSAIYKGTIGSSEESFCVKGPKYCERVTHRNINYTQRATRRMKIFISRGRRMYKIVFTHCIIPTAYTTVEVRKSLLSREGTMEY